MSARPARPRGDRLRFRPRPSPAVAGLYPLHAVLAALLTGLAAGPRSEAIVLALVAVLLATGAAIVALPAARPLAAGSVARDGIAEEVGVSAARVAVVAVSAACALLAGAVLAEARLGALDRTALVPRHDVLLTGFVADAPRRRSFGVVVAPVRVGAGAGAGEVVLLRARARVRLPAMRVGDEIRIRGDLRALAPHEGFERRRGVHAALDADAVAATGRTRGSAVDAVRRRAEDALGAGMPPEQAALARGMVLGQDAALPDDLREAFRASGLAHLVAASGANVMLLASLVLGMGGLLGVPLRARLGAAIAAIALYVPLAGAGPSIQRAGVMGVAGLLAALAGRPASRWYAVLLAGAATLALNPRAVEDPGWQLSFAAVLAILALHRRIAGAMAERGCPRPLADAAALTLAATAGTAPLLSLHFGRLSLVSVPANLLAVPAVAPVMWLGTLAAMLGGDAARLLGALSSLPLAYLTWLGRTAAALPHASVGAQLSGPLAAVAAYALLAAACAAPRAVAALPEPVRRRLVRAGVLTAPVGGGVRLRWATAVPAAVLVSACALLLAPGPPPPPAGPTLSMLDVGQGGAVLLQDGHRAMLVDTGPPGAPLLRELRAAGVRRLDAVLVTHSAADHAGGLPALLRAMPVGLVLDGRGPGRAGGGEGSGARFEGLPAAVPRAVPAAGQVLRLGSIAVDVLWPPPGDRRLGEPNDTAAVVLARAGRRSALLTADAESNVTLPLDLPPVDVLQVAHHGSDDAGLPALLRRLRPRVALIPVGRNPYGHPTPATLAALRVVPVVRRTDRDGTVRVPLDGSPPAVRG